MIVELVKMLLSFVGTMVVLVASMTIIGEVARIFIVP